jgi:hypothetical protein
MPLLIVKILLPQYVQPFKLPVVNETESVMVKV